MLQTPKTIYETAFTTQLNFTRLCTNIIITGGTPWEHSSRPHPLTGDKREATEHTEQRERVSCCVGLFTDECLHAVPPKRARSEEQ